MDTAFGLRPAAPAPRACILANRRAAGARHASDGEKARRQQGMRRQPALRIDRLDRFARNVGEGIELQPDTNVLDHRNGGAQPALKTLAPVDPGVEWRQRPLQRLDLPDAAAGVRIGEPQLAIAVLALQRLLLRTDGANVAQSEGTLVPLLSVMNQEVAAEYAQ